MKQAAVSTVPLCIAGQGKKNIKCMKYKSKRRLERRVRLVLYTLSLYDLLISFSGIVYTKLLGEKKTYVGYPRDLSAFCICLLVAV